MYLVQQTLPYWLQFRAYSLYNRQTFDITFQLGDYRWAWGQCLTANGKQRIDQNEKYFVSAWLAKKRSIILNLNYKDQLLILYNKVHHQLPLLHSTRLYGKVVWVWTYFSVSLECITFSDIAFWTYYIFFSKSCFKKT